MQGSIDDVRLRIQSGETVISIVEQYLSKIEENKALNAFIEVFHESVRANAIAVDKKIVDGTAGKLAGVVVGIKDNICYKNHHVSCSSKILAGFESLYTATALQRLLDEDAIVIGRLNCDEFAMGSSNETSVFGTVKNNHNMAYVPGGSSGGSAVAVSAGLCTAALGSDTGGSVRQPASWTGIYGLKPTYGRISRYGLIAYASSFDQIGTFTNCIEDAVLLYSIMAGEDQLDATTSSLPFATNFPLANKSVRVGVLMEGLNHPGLDPEIKCEMDDFITKLSGQGLEIIPISFPFLDYIVPTYYVLSTAEASSNLSRFDGVHYGYRSSRAKGVEETYVLSRSEGFGPEVKRRIMTGAFVLSQGYYDAYYTKAQKVRRLMKNATDAIFNTVDVLLLPTTPTTAFEIGAIKDPIQMYLQDIFTVHANITGNPAVSIPFKTHSNGMPYGIQIMSNRFEEDKLFNFAKFLEEITI
jgi:aspartyl-tRNA(Asn)/glutamyl-tRNA(Gln) amidotransferase subunit A